jgi:large subunit ribosomal protein L5
MMTSMRDPMIYKVVVHMSVGEAGEKLTNAENIMREITGQQPIRVMAKRTQPAFGIRKGQPMGCKVSLRGDVAETFVATALDIVERRMSASQFDKNGNFGFGIEEHTDFPGQSYDPSIGIYGMDIAVILERRGKRIARRLVEQKKLPEKQRVSREDAIGFLQERYQVEVI